MSLEYRSRAEKASETKGKEHETRAGRMAAWTSAYGKRDASNPWSFDRYGESKLKFDPLEAKFYMLTWDGQLASLGEQLPPTSWSTGSRRQINVGDRVLLLRQTAQPVGFVAMGSIIGRPQEVPHINAARRAAGSTSLVAATSWEFFGTEPLLGRADLPRYLRDKILWDARGGGQLIDRLGTGPDGLGLFIDQEMRRVANGVEQETNATSEIDTDPTLTATEKDTLRKARIGQGRFRNNVLQLEGSGCRLTGVRDARHLRASHIKPWAVSTNKERLDGHNGLMLTPTADHLFDKGFISFSNDGRLLVAGDCIDPNEIEALGLRAAVEHRSFTSHQKRYLDYHRSYVFRQSEHPLAPIP